MVFSNLKARIFKYCDLGWKELSLLKAWSKLSASFNGFDDFASPSLQIAVATNEQNQPIVFCPVERVLLVSCYAVSPSVSPEEATRAGDVLDAAIARAGQQQGITKLILLIPNGQPLPPGEWEEVRSYTRKIPSTINTHLGCSTPLQATQYIN